VPLLGEKCNEILGTAKKLGIKVTLIDLQDVQAAQRSPCAFGTFCIIYDGKILSHHPISNNRFKNIIEKTN
jgi:hypothetical protein